MSRFVSLVVKMNILFLVFFFFWREWSSSNFSLLLIGICTKDCFNNTCRCRCNWVAYSCHPTRAQSGLSWWSYYDSFPSFLAYIPSSLQFICMLSAINIRSWMIMPFLPEYVFPCTKQAYRWIHRVYDWVFLLRLCSRACLAQNLLECSGIKVL